MRTLLLLALIISIPACVADGLKPSVWSFPPGYLETFPLDSLTESELFQQVGPADQEITMDGNKGYVYRLGQNNVARSYTYLIRDNRVHDVIYHENGPYNGRSARREQGKP